MATVGDQLLQPEAGWRRYDDRDSSIYYDLENSGVNIGPVENAPSYNQTVYQIYKGKAIFKFTGTKIRLISFKSATTAYNSSTYVKIDGVNVGSYNNYGASIQYQIILFEKLDLSDSTHIIEIINPNANGTVFVIDAIDIGESNTISSAIDTTLESGLKRFQDSYATIKYIGIDWINVIGNHYTDTKAKALPTGLSVEQIKTNYIEFKFIGTKLKIFGDKKIEYSNDISIIIDGNTTRGNATASGMYIEPIINITGLTNSIHIVKIVSNDGLPFSIDCIDTDGRIVHYILPEKTSLVNMEIGDVISCEYISNTGNNSNGFNNLGAAVKNGIDPAASSASPDGSFFFIKVDKGLLIADRVLQHTVRWDQLNLSKLINGSLYRMHYNSQKISPGCLVDYIDPKIIYFRTLTGVAHTGAYIAIQKPMKATGTLVVEYDYYPTGAYSSAYNQYITITKDFKTVEAYYNSPSTRNAGYIFSGGMTPVNTWVKVKYTINFNTGAQSITVNDAVPGGISAVPPTGMTVTDDVYVCIGVGPYEVALNDGLKNLKFTYNGEVSEIDFTIPNVLVRSMTGGIAALAANGTPSLTATELGAFPTENEYDKYIKRSTLGGRITPGDNTIWNIDDIFSWCKEPFLIGTHVSSTGNTVTALNTFRVARGAELRTSSFKNFGGGLASGSSNIIGFRPVLEYIDNNGQTNNWY